MWSPVCDYIKLDAKIENKEGESMEPVNKELENSISTLETIERGIQKAELEKKDIIEHLNYLYKEYYTARKNIEKRENNI